MNLDGSGRRKIATTVSTTGPRWSPSALPNQRLMIAFLDHGPKAPSGTNQRDVFLVGPDGTGRVNLTNSPSRYEWSCGWGPDGSTLYVTYDHQLSRLTLGLDASGNPVVAFEETVWTFDNTPWQPCYANASDALVLRVSGDPYSRLYQLDPTVPSQPDLVTLASNHDEMSPSFSPDDSRIVFWRGGSRGGIFTVNRDGTGEVRISAKGRTPDWKRPENPGGGLSEMTN